MDYSTYIGLVYPHTKGIGSYHYLYTACFPHTQALALLFDGEASVEAGSRKALIT